MDRQVVEVSSLSLSFSWLFSRATWFVGNKGFLEHKVWPWPPSLLVAAGKELLAFRRCVSLCGRLKLIRKKLEITFLRWPQERSSPEFAGVRRGSSGPNLLRENVVAKVEKLVIKMRFYFLRAVFSMRLRGENVKTHVGNVWTSLRARLSSSEFVGLKVVQTA